MSYEEAAAIIITNLTALAGQYKMLSYRLTKVEDKLEKHNKFAERIARVEANQEYGRRSSDHAMAD